MSFITASGPEVLIKEPPRRHLCKYVVVKYPDVASVSLSKTWLEEWKGDNPGQQLYHARAEQLGELGLPGCDEALSGMGGASLTNEVPGVM